MDDPAQLVDQMASLLDLPLDPASRPGVIGYFAGNMALAALVLEFPLPEDLEAAPEFRP